MRNIAKIVGLLPAVLWFALSPAHGQTTPSGGAGPLDLKLPESVLRESGAFGFPQKEAKVLCDTPDLRFSVWNNGQYLYAQAIVWQDNDSALGKTDDGRTIGDYSNLMLAVDPDGKLTPNQDRTYMLNPWPTLPGLQYNILLGGGSSTHIMNDTKGHGAIRYIQTSAGKRIRVDLYLIPLAEISKHVPDKIRLCYWGNSPLPALTVNSAGYQSGGRPYYGFSIPRTNYQTYDLTQGSELALESVPDGHLDPSSETPRHAQPMPKIGDIAPEIAAKDWLNADHAPALARMRGQVVLVEFWATWCGPCIASIPHLNELQKKYAANGFKIVSFTEQNRDGIAKFIKTTPMAYTIGLEGMDTFDHFGVSGIPQAFVVDKSGTIAWAGNSGDAALEDAIKNALKGNGSGN